MFQHTIIGSATGEGNVVAFIPGDPMPLAAHSSHPNYERIVALLQGSDPAIPVEDFRRLFDVAQAVADKFARLSERVTVSGGHVYFDGDEVHTSLTKAIIRFLDGDEDDWRPLVSFFENVQANPNVHSREQLYDWLEAHDFTLSRDGMIVGYKGVMKDDNGDLVSVHSGRAIVDGNVVSGHIPNAVGSVVEMPRSEVMHDPSQACSRGLHVATFSFAQSWSRNGAMLKVLVNPRDVCSVPTDGGGQKVRVCRYKVESIINEALAVPLDSSYWDDEDYIDGDEWGDGEDY